MKTETTTLNLRIKTTNKGHIELIDNEYNPVAKMVWYPEELDNKAARQIANAVNAHEELLGALKFFVDAMTICSDRKELKVNETYAINKARAAIAKAEAR